MFSRIIPDTWRTCTAFAAPAVTALCLIVAALLPGGLIEHPLVALSLLFVVVVVAILSALMMGGWLFSPKAFQPDFTGSLLHQLAVRGSVEQRTRRGGVGMLGG